MMKIGQLRELTTEELTQKLKDLKAELFNLRFQQATNQLDNPMRIVEVKKTIARVRHAVKRGRAEKDCIVKGGI